MTERTFNWRRPLAEFIAIFAGWAMRREDTRDELTSLTSGNFAFWHFLIRFVVPPALLVIFVQGMRG